MAGAEAQLLRKNVFPAHLSVTRGSLTFRIIFHTDKAYQQQCEQSNPPQVFFTRSISIIRWGAPAEPSPRVQCGTCRRFLMHGRFSNRQLDRYRGQYRQNRGNAANITLPDCMNCTGRPATELKCTQCDITKGLDAFTKVQRKNPDNAVR